MARTASKRRRAPRRPQPLPPPLPPEERSVGQLVAETIRFYQHHFFQTLPLGLSVAALTQLTVAFGHRRVEPRGHPPPRDFDTPTSLLGGGIEVTILLGALLLTASYIVAIVLVTGKRPAGRALAIAYGLGVLVFLPVPLLAQLLVRPPSRTWRSPAGSSRPRWSRAGALRTASAARTELARVDFVHALAGLATLVIVFYVVRLMLALLLWTGSAGHRAVRRPLPRRPGPVADAVRGRGDPLPGPGCRVRVRASKLEAPTQEA